jgi:hypothetical protein
MPTPENMLWFKQQFRAQIEAAVQGTPFTLDMLTAIASQETGEIWPTLRKAGLSVERILELCVGDTLDAGGGRDPKAFPKNKAELVAYPRGVEMFGIARQALEDMAKYIKGYQPILANKNKFCHGFGIFQMDIQYFKVDPDYFLQKRYADFGECLAKCIGELKEKLNTVKTLAHLRGKSKLSEQELGAHSLNEPGQPNGRKGQTPDQLRAELNAIIDYLAVDKVAHRRYQPREGKTFCNIYAHDYCHLAGVYLPRVWWTPAAIEKLAQGQTVQPPLYNTIDEVRANGLFGWLRDFGLRFGWRRTGDLAKLQQDANLGAVALIVARRHDEGPPGHITAVIPESSGLTARRNPQGQVIAPVQSQAGRRNFRRDTGPAQWWLGGDFAEFAFWVHA